MKATSVLALLATFSLAASAGAQRYSTVSIYPTPSLSTTELGLTGGYAGGKGGQIFVNVKNVAGPLGVRLSASRGTGSDGFNDSADLSAGVLGTIGQQKASGLITSEPSSANTYGLDASYDLGQIAPGVTTNVYGGVRYGTFNSRLNYSGGQYTDYSSSAFGLGAGATVGYLLTNNLSLIGDLGADYYFKRGTINTQDNKGNTDTFTENQSGYAAVNSAVNRPSTVVKAGVGLRYSF